MIGKFFVSIQGMENDFITAKNSFEREDLGEFNEEDLLNALQTYSTIDYSADDRFPPKLFISVRNERFTVTVDYGQLLLNNSANQNQVNLKVSPRDVVDIVQGKTPSSQEEEKDEIEIVVENRSSKNAPAILAGCGLLLFASIGFSLYQFKHDSVPMKEPVPFTEITDTKNVDMMKQRYVGTYFSGQQAGDVAIVLHANLKFQFFVFIEAGEPKRLELRLVDEAPFAFGNLRNQSVAVINGNETIFLQDGSRVAFHKMLLERYSGSYIDYLPEKSS